MDPSASDTRQLCQRMIAEAHEARFSTLSFAIALGVAVVGLILFACALILI